MFYTYNLVKFPNPILLTPCKKVTKFDYDYLNSLINRMVVVMMSNKGCGLAANQIGVNKAVCVILYENRIHTLINPKIEQKRGSMVVREGCLSSDTGEIIETERSRKVFVTYNDIKGDTKKIRAKGLLAHILQHEIDHLSGIYYKYMERK